MGNNDGTIVDNWCIQHRHSLCHSVAVTVDDGMFEPWKHALFSLLAEVMSSLNLFN